MRPFRIITVKFKTYKFYFSVPWRWTDRAHVTKRRIHGWIAKGFWIYVSLRNGGRTCILWSTIASKGMKNLLLYTFYCVRFFSEMAFSLSSYILNRSQIFDSIFKFGLINFKVTGTLHQKVWKTCCYTLFISLKLFLKGKFSYFYIKAGSYILGFWEESCSIFEVWFIKFKMYEKLVAIHFLFG